MSDFDPIAYINEPRWQQSRLGLERITELLERMGRPQDRLRVVHVAGTNGKGSTCAYLESALRCAGYATGLFTSPYVICFEERIRVNGRNIGADDLREVTLFVRGHAEAMERESGEHPTEFELMCAVAFEHFARSGCDVVVCEVGMGGRLDSTNVVERPEVCVITRIGLDHTEYLGDTPGAVAAEKAGIVKPGAAVVSWPQEDPDAMAAIRQAAERAGCSLMMPDFSQLDVKGLGGGAVRAFCYRGGRFTTRLLGSYQPYNAALAIEAVDALRQRGWQISDDELACGIAGAVWPGRFEVVGDARPPMVVDGGHNPQGASVLADSLRDAFPEACAGRRVVFVMSVLADKDYLAMADAVAPLARAFVCATPPNPRALPAVDLAAAIAARHPSVLAASAPDFGAAMERAREIAGPDGVVCAFGSLYSLGEIAPLLGEGSPS